VTVLPVIFPYPQSGSLIEPSEVFFTKFYHLSLINHLTCSPLAATLASSRYIRKLPGPLFVAPAPHEATPRKSSIFGDLSRIYSM
jgi:hypothetical protein